MSELNKKIRSFLEKTTQHHRSKNCFEWGNLRVQTDIDSPHKGVEFEEWVKVSIYDRDSDTLMIMYIKADTVFFIDG